ncbi:hypothetical protein [Clostridium uliginosum]|uniref:Viral A-type inclusion protein n=1 Tax=Clostridium uliginosum TaxID=119641 RepID=A0A1I1HVH3_9CLOT|nr:hypothetical protein [Clostridium uliginosum]SFC27881.1 hypothetical protein SAMN05421842_10222 [Clostridium uliginosum]
MKKTSFFKKNDAEVETSQMFEQTNEKGEYRGDNSKKKNLSIIDKNIIKYVIDQFPSMSVEIRSSLTNLANTLENTIDYIEDKSSYAVKTERDFELSESHRNTSIAIYDIVQSIDKYVKWMEEEYEEAINNNEISIKNSELKTNETNIELQSQHINSDIDIEGGIEIYKDFSLKEPKAFKLDDNIIEVENWDDLLVKTAEVLTKKYKKNKNSDKVVNTDIKILEKKSNENTLRNTVIEMLNEYKISLNDFKLIVQDK